MLRSALREYYPAALAAFDSLTKGDALAILGRAPTPHQGARLSLSKNSAAPKLQGVNAISTPGPAISKPHYAPHLAAPESVASAFGATTRAAVNIIAELNDQIAELEAALADHFETHPDADIYLSLPGLGVILGARVLGEFGDDPNRYTTAKSRKKLHPNITTDRGVGPQTRSAGPPRSQQTSLRRHRPMGLLRSDYQPGRT